MVIAVAMIVWLGNAKHISIQYSATDSEAMATTVQYCTTRLFRYQGNEKQIRKDRSVCRHFLSIQDLAAARFITVPAIRESAVSCFNPRRVLRKNRKHSQTGGSYGHDLSRFIISLIHGIEVSALLIFT